MRLYCVKPELAIVGAQVSACWDQRVHNSRSKYRTLLKPCRSSQSCSYVIEIASSLYLDDYKSTADRQISRNNIDLCKEGGVLDRVRSRLITLVQVNLEGYVAQIFLS